MNINHYLQKAKNKQKEHLKILNKIKTNTPKNLDTIMQEIHHKVFNKIDCLSCANCCKTTGPLFTKQDIERISKHLKIKSTEFENKYLKIDEDGDFVLKTLPCNFLDTENYCSIYEVRPKACREYPHLDRKKFQQINHLTIQNALICPATYEALEELNKEVFEK